MDSSTRFRFRDSVDGGSTSEESSVSSCTDDESELQSMSAKGIKHLCSELVDLKKASNEEFHKTVYLNYPAFVRIFKEVGGIENEMMQLKQQVSNHRKLVKDLVDGVYLEILSEESVESIFEEFRDADQSPTNNLEAPIDAIPETLDILLSEQRLDEALAILEKEIRSLKMTQLQEDRTPRFLMSYYASISERKSRLANQFAVLASHPRVPTPEFQKALTGLCRLGDNQRATQLLLGFYHSRLENAMHGLQSSKPSLHGRYIRELAKSVFSTISQAARSFIALYGEKSPYASELIQWACEETEVFVSCFYKYVKSISEINGGLAAAVDAVDSALSFCSILETQCIVLRPYLIKLIRPCMEEVLEMHIYHYKKVIGIFTASDAWILDKYLILEFLKEEATPVGNCHESECCILTTSSWKFLTLLQAIMKDLFPLIVLQMETSILNGLMELLSEYINILERAIASKADVSETSGSIIILAQTLKQQLSVLVDASALVDIFSSTARNILKGTKQFGGEIITDHLVFSFEKEIDDRIFLIQDAANQPKASFCQQFIRRVTSPEGGLRLRPETYIDDQSSVIFHDLTPSLAFEVLFLELRKIEKIGKEVFGGEDWLLEELLRALMESIFVWISSNQDFWKAIEEASIVHQSNGFWQFVLDMQFLLEITRFGGYFSDNLIDAALGLTSRMESAFLLAGLDPYRNVVDDGWVTNAATESILKLLEMEQTESPYAEEPVASIGVDSDGPHYGHGSDSVAGDTDSLEDYSEMDDGLAINASKVLNPVGQEIKKLELTSAAESNNHTEVEGRFDDKGLGSSTIDLETVEAENNVKIQDAKKSELLTAETSSGIAEEASGEL